ncbi:hypothetical protein, conserved [Entamoeba dispar SAW760]|uniref:Uncharacterized protein n=1 Tax=Entamoeba dispar (strain ATCC PRA-260 / SAW760) TaxID=370354 RepID=B0EE47_ENTDS|nr:uncharacterized protein EDI_077850 [Entamoeba dispar SAW760]EDR27205.1 hypothetical protein, conserved [Entamoeba dispar SAW760]|eukprot:EDR27205.1 hypothetical protein, conserved [Entamoeba dispar SAW760]
MEQPTKKAVIPFWILWSGLIVLNLFILIVTITSACLLGNEIDNVFVEKERFLNSTKKYMSYYNTMTGIENQIKDIPSWVYSAIAFCEASYRKNGLEKGYLESDEYVGFDEEIFYSTLKRLCQEKSNKYCNVVENNGSPELLYYLYELFGNELVKGISPRGYVSDLSKNPIKFDITGIHSVYTKSNVTKLMKDSGLPLTLSFGTFKRRYSVPCSNSFGYVCPNNLPKVPCPSSLGGDCVVLTFNPYSQSGVYDYLGDLHYNKKHSVLVVGWNDEKRIDRSWGNDLHNFFDGGYIVKNSFGYQHGHSLKYWLQQHSIKEEMQICPNVRSFEQWTPLDEDCINKYSYTECCNQYIKRGVKKYINATITPLICDSSKDDKYQGIFKCDTSRIYFIKSKKHSFGPYKSYGTLDITPINGINMFTIKLLSFKRDMTDKQTITIQPTCPEMLEDIFKASYTKSDEEATTNTEECGYDFIPFKVLEKYNENYVVDGLHAPAFSIFDIKWDDQSYLNSHTQGMDYSAIQSATKKVYQTVFKGPYDMN